jgi:hypothetical protein
MSAIPILDRLVKINEFKESFESFSLISYIEQYKY